MAGTLNDSLKGMSPAEAASARSFSRIVVSAIRAAANPNDPNQAFAQALLGDVLGQAGQQDAAQMPQIPAPYVPPAPSPAAEPAETAEPAAPTEPPAPAETPPPVESVPPGPVLPLTDTTLFDAAGHLQPGIVDTSAPTAVQAQQLADQLQQRGLTADEAASEAARYIGSSAASVPRDSAEPTAPEPLPPVADDTTPGAVGPQPSGPSDEPPRRVEIIGSKPVKDALGNIYQTDANGGQRIYLTNGSILILPPEQAATISVDQAGAGAAVLMDAALLSRLALVARAGVALVTLVNPVTLAIGATVVIGGTALYLWRSQSSDTVDLDSDTRFEQHPDEPFGTVYEKSADGDWEAMPGRFKLVQGAGRYMLLSEDEIARYGQPITTPAQPPGPSGPPALPVPVDPNVQMPGYPRDTPAIPPLEGSPAQPVSPDDLLIESRNSEELGRNLEAAGMPKPAPGYQPHHMAPVRAGGADMDAVRSKLATLGIDINDAVNGVWLPGASAEEVRGEPAYHPRLNNAEYNEAIVDAFRSVNTAEDAIRVLSDIRSQLQNGDFPGARPRPMPPSNRIQP